MLFVASDPQMTCYDETNCTNITEEEGFFMEPNDQFMLDEVPELTARHEQQSETSKERNKSSYESISNTRNIQLDALLITSENRNHCQDTSQFSETASSASLTSLQHQYHNPETTELFETLQDIERPLPVTEKKQTWTFNKNVETEIFEESTDCAKLSGTDILNEDLAAKDKNVNEETTVEQDFLLINEITVAGTSSLFAQTRRCGPDSDDVFETLQDVMSPRVEPETTEKWSCDENYETETCQEKTDFVNLDGANFFKAALVIKRNEVDETTDIAQNFLLTIEDTVSVISSPFTKPQYCSLDTADLFNTLQEVMSPRLGSEKREKWICDEFDVAKKGEGSADNIEMVGTRSRAENLVPRDNRVNEMTSIAQDFLLTDGDRFAGESSPLCETFQEITSPYSTPENKQKGIFDENYETEINEEKTDSVEFAGSDIIYNDLVQIGNEDNETTEFTQDFLLIDQNPANRVSSPLFETFNEMTSPRSTPELKQKYIFDDNYETETGKEKENNMKLVRIDSLNKDLVERNNGVDETVNFTNDFLIIDRDRATDVPSPLFETFGESPNPYSTPENRQKYIFDEDYEAEIGDENVYNMDTVKTSHSAKNFSERDDEPDETTELAENEFVTNQDLFLEMPFMQQQCCSLETAKLLSKWQNLIYSDVGPEENENWTMYLASVKKFGQEKEPPNGNEGQSADSQQHCVAENIEMDENTPPPGTAGESETKEVDQHFVETNSMTGNLFRHKIKKGIVDLSPSCDKDLLNCSSGFDSRCRQYFLSAVAVNQNSKKSAVNDSSLQQKSDTVQMRCNSSLGTANRQSSVDNQKNSQQLNSIPCDKCNKVFSDIKTLNRHVNVAHRNFKPHLCTECKRPFSTKQQLIAHLKGVHLKVIICNKCNKRFSDLESLTSHTKKVHQKFKPYLCTKCGKLFARNHHLLEHINEVHEKVKLYSCDLCEKSFPRRDALAHHTKAVHCKLMPLLCTKCHKLFGYKTYQQNRIDVGHHKIKQYTCDECETKLSSAAI